MPRMTLKTPSVVNISESKPLKDLVFDLTKDQSVDREEVANAARKKIYEDLTVRKGSYKGILGLSTPMKANLAGNLSGLLW